MLFRSVSGRVSHGRPSVAPSKSSVWPNPASPSRAACNTNWCLRETSRSLDERVRPRNRMRENRTSGSVAGAPGNRSPYAGDVLLGATSKGPGKRYDLTRFPTILKQQVLLVHHEGEGRSNRARLSSQTTTMDKDNLRQIRQ